MNNFSRAICCQVLLLVIAGGAQAEGLPRPNEISKKQIFADWRDRASRINSITLVAKGTGLLVRGYYNRFRSMSDKLSEDDDFPESDHTYPVELELRVDYERSLLWKTKREDNLFLDDAQLVSQTITRVFDGENCVRVTPKSGNPHWQWGEQLPNVDNEIVYLPKQDLITFIVRSDYPWLFGLGVLPTSGKAITPDGFDEGLDSTNFSVHGTGEIDGREQVVLRSQPVSTSPGHFYEYYVDVDRQSAISRWVRYMGGVPSEQYNMTLEYNGQLWLPSQWKWMAFVDGRVAQQETMTVVSLELNPSFEKSMFMVTPVPGSIVGDRSGLEESTHIVQDDGSLKDFDDALMEGRQGSLAYVLLCTGTLFCAILCAWFVIKKTRSAKRKGE